MPRKPKDYKLLSVKLDRTLHDRLEVYCDVEGRTKTTSIERILKKYLDEYDQKHGDITKKQIKE